MLIEIIEFFKYVHEKTKTSLYDEKVLNTLENDNEKMKLLEKEISNYKKTGKWDMKVLNKIRN